MPRFTTTPTETPKLAGDADCNRVVDGADADATCVAVFDVVAQAACDADCNRDERVSAADILCVMQRMESP